MSLNSISVFYAVMLVFLSFVSGRLRRLRNEESTEMAIVNFERQRNEK